MSSKWQIKLSYVAMCIDLNEIFLFLILLHENITAGRIKFSLLHHVNTWSQMCMSVIDLSCTVLGIPVTTFFFSWLYWNWFSVNQTSIVIHKLFTFLCLLILLSYCWICSFFQVIFIVLMFKTFCILFIMIRLHEVNNFAYNCNKHWLLNWKEGKCFVQCIWGSYKSLVL